MTMALLLSAIIRVSYSVENLCNFFRGKQRGAVEACSAHNRKDVGSKPTAAICGIKLL